MKTLVDWLWVAGEVVGSSTAQLASRLLFLLPALFACWPAVAYAVTFGDGSEFSDGQLPEWAFLAIPLVVKALRELVTRYVPDAVLEEIQKHWLPLIAAVLGVAAESYMNGGSLAQPVLADGIKNGLAGVGAFEAYKEWMVKRPLRLGNGNAAPPKPDPENPPVGDGE